MGRMPRRRAVLAVRAVKGAATASLAAAAVALTLGHAIAETPADSSTSPGSPRVIEQMDARCEGAAGRALVLRPNGVTKRVSFSHGWKVYRGERPGTLVTVCPD
ncbi:hypothetical protein [Nocardioides sp.]|uniref:hypothetical protein n=1 Tax=Nocardioides sp. TaxID=35761 RepID=UPI00356683A9